MSNKETEFCALATPFYVINPDGACNGDAVSAALMEGYDRDGAVPPGSNITNEEYAQQYDCRFCPTSTSYIGDEMTGNCVPDSVLSSNVSDEDKYAFISKILSNDGCGEAETRTRHFKIVGYFDKGFITEAGVETILNKPIPVCATAGDQQCLKTMFNAPPTPGYNEEDFWGEEVQDA